MSTQSIKQRFGIIGTSQQLDRAIDVAQRVAPTDLTVLITGESGTGKEVMPQVIHQLSSRKHGSYIAVNCGAIPEGTIDSELFGHEKGSFTGAHDSRKGYFEVANGGTIFLDEVAELPIQTQVRLLRVLETGEFIKVGSSKVIKTDVRIVAATNVDIPAAIRDGKFREDLYYRLNTVPISIPALRERKEDIHLLFRKFAADFAEKYRMPAVQLAEDAVQVISNYAWPGNIRQLKNFTEQLSIIESNRMADAEVVRRYLPDAPTSQLPVLVDKSAPEGEFSDRELLYKVLFDLKKDVSDMKKLVLELLQRGGSFEMNEESSNIVKNLYGESAPVPATPIALPANATSEERFHEHVEVEESLSLEDREKELIQRALEKHKGKRKYAAKALGISERTLYRKIKEYDIA